jgi:hypothetical protein
VSTEEKRKLAFTLSWPPAVILVLILVVGELIGARYRLFTPSTSALLILFAVLLVVYTAVAENRLQFGRAVAATTILVAFVTILDIGGIAHLMGLLLGGGKSIHGGLLLSSGVYFWGTNVLTFGLWYWLIDRGGPHIRARGERRSPEFLFPEMTAGEENVQNWRGPDLIEYMYLSYTNATAFSPTDTLPLSSRARVLMALESTTSLATVALVTARAVNILS